MYAELKEKSEKGLREKIKWYDAIEETAGQLPNNLEIDIEIFRKILSWGKSTGKIPE